MKDSITFLKKAKKTKSQRVFETLLAVAFWIFIWYLASKLIKQEMFLASPVSVAKELFSLIGTLEFWERVAFSVSKMGGGFLFALGGGMILAVLAYKIALVEMLLNPIMIVIKASPVASYIILFLLLMPTKTLPLVISFLMALPIIYTNVLQGFQKTDPLLLEMADAFQIKPFRRAVYIYFSQMMPYLLSACSIALGLCWKSGIAAEVIALPLGSIGEQLYQAKIFVNSKGVLAWTVVVIAISFVFEKVFLAVLKKLASLVERA